MRLEIMENTVKTKDQGMATTAFESRCIQEKTK